MDEIMEMFVSIAEQDYDAALELLQSMTAYMEELNGMEADEDKGRNKPNGGYAYNRDSDYVVTPNDGKARRVQRIKSMSQWLQENE